MLQRIESKYNVIYPQTEHATYASLLNYSQEGQSAFQRWYRYKEGFSIKFIENIIKEYHVGRKGIILDPFAGSGTTILTANKMGFPGIGFEVNPFSYFLMKTKTQAYSSKEVDQFEAAFTSIIKEIKQDSLENYSLPALSISGQVFQPETERYVMSCKVKINKRKRDKVWELLFLGWLSCIEILSNYRKAGNGLKRKKTIKPIIVKKNDVISQLSLEYENMLEDLKRRKINLPPSTTYNRSSLSFAKSVGKNTIDGIIFSPPYANCFDYTEIYKLELWFGDFVSSYEDLKKLRNNSLKSHLNIRYDYKELKSDKSKLLNSVLKKIIVADLWDKKIPQMIHGYFEDMFNIIDNCFASLKKKGFCAIVVGNSAYGGVILPTDLILAEYAASIGFIVDKIEIDRFIITSSQQYEKTKGQAKYLRESVICLKK